MGQGKWQGSATNKKLETNKRISARATVNEECVSTWNDLKLSKKHKYIIFKLSDDLKEIVVEHTSDNKDWEEFRNRLVNAKTVSKTVRSWPFLENSLPA